MQHFGPIPDAHLAPPSTGEKNIECPDTIRERDSPESPTREVPCPYRTHDRSLLTRHRKKKHAYIPRPRASPQRPTTVTFGSSATISASTTTRKTTSNVEKPKQVQKQKDGVQRPEASQARTAHKAKKSTGREAEEKPKLASMSQENVDEHGLLANASSVDAASSGSSSSTSTTSVAPHRGISPDAHGQLTHAESSYASNTTSVVPNQGISNAYGHRDYVQSLDAAGYNNTLSVTANQGMPSNPRGLLAYTQSPVANTSNSATLAHAQGQSSYGASQVATGSTFAGFSGTTSVTPNQGTSINVPFGPLENANWSTFHTDSFTAPSTRGTYNPATNPQMYTFASNGSSAGPGMEGWSLCDWNNLWVQYN